MNEIVPYIERIHEYRSIEDLPWWIRYNKDFSVIHNAGKDMLVVGGTTCKKVIPCGTVFYLRSDGEIGMYVIRPPYNLPYQMYPYTESIVTTETKHKRSCGRGLTAPYYYFIDSDGIEHSEGVIR